MPEDPQLSIDLEGMQEFSDAMTSTLEQDQQQQEAATALEQQTVAEETQGQAEVDDPRNAENWGFKALVKEGQSILSGGLQDTASSIATFPERTIDAFSGEMAKDRKEQGYYRPDWHPFTDYENPIITKTWWGKLARGVVHFGSLALGTVATLKAAGVTAPVWLTSLGGYSLIRAAGIGAVSDLVSKESDGHNALGSLRDQFGFIDTPLSTQETDHPVMMKFKNIVEGMGIGTLFDLAALGVGKGGKKVLNQIEARNLSIERQTTEAGLSQLRKGEVEFRADKNKPVAAEHQGAHISEQDAMDALDTQRKIRKIGALKKDLRVL